MFHELVLTTCQASVSEQGEALPPRHLVSRLERDNYKETSRDRHTENEERRSDQGRVKLFLGGDAGGER